MMFRNIRISMLALPVAVLGLIIAGCQPQEQAIMSDEPMAEMPATLSGVETMDILTGHTIFGTLDAWKLTWAEYFAPDGTSASVLRFENQPDMEIAGTYYINDQDQFCTQYPELAPNQTVFCNRIVALGDGQYQQVWDDGSMGAVYNQVLEGDQLEAFGKM